MSNLIQDRMNDAVELAKQAASEDEVPVGALIIKDGVVISRAYNQKEKTLNPTAHAEILAIQKACEALKSWRLLGCQLVVTLEPCPMCLAACQQARLDEVIYGAKDPKGGAMSLGYNLHEDIRINHRFKVSYLKSADSENILKEFFKKKR